MSKYRVTQKPLNLIYSLVLKGMFRLKLVSQFVERDHSIASSATEDEGPRFESASNTEISEIL